MPELSSRLYLKVWRWVLYLAPLWWVLGLVFFVYHLTAVILFVFLLLHLRQTQQTISLPPSFFLLFFLVIFYGASLLIHAPDHEMRRVAAAFYNLSFWIMGLCLIAVMSNVFKSSD